MILVIHRLPLSPNALRGHHWSVKNKDKNDWIEQIWAALKPGERLACAELEKKLVRINLFSPHRAMDPDNLHGAIKPILDALKANRLIQDDSGEWLEYRVRSRSCGANAKRTEITVEKWQ